MERTITYGCSVYGNAAMTVEPGIGDTIAFEICDDEGDQLAAVLIDKDHAVRLIEQLSALVGEMK